MSALQQQSEGEVTDKKHVMGMAQWWGKGEAAKPKQKHKHMIRDLKVNEKMIGKQVKTRASQDLSQMLFKLNPMSQCSPLLSLQLS